MKTNNEVKEEIVTVYPAKDILTEQELLECKNVPNKCHYNAAFNSDERNGVMYVEGYIEESGVAHAVNKTPDGKYFDIMTNNPYQFIPVKEYTSSEIMTIHRTMGRSFLTIGNDNYYRK